MIVIWKLEGRDRTLPPDGFLSEDQIYVAPNQFDKTN